MGRPGPKSKYDRWLTPDGLILLQAWARDGLTDEQIAHNMGITAKTLYEWKNRFSEIREATKKGKEVADIEVENALFKRAMGYSYEEVTTERRVDPDTGDVQMVETKRVTKEVLPDTTAQIFWLKNRKPKEWRDKRDVEVSGEVNNPFQGLTTEELRKLIKK